MDAQLKSLLSLLDESFTGKAWHGPALRETIGGVNRAAASWRPSPDRHNIWEIVVHAAFWTHVVNIRLSGKTSAKFPLRGHDWFARPSGPRTWKEDVQLLMTKQAELVHVVKGLDPAILRKQVHGRRHTYEFTIRGIAAHHLYHAGQIQLLKAMQQG